MTSAASSQIPATGQAPRPSAAGGRDLLIYALLLAATAGVYQLSQSDLYTAGSDAGYWMGVVGGVMMLLLFAYPLRKRWPALAKVGKTKNWFVLHMILGVGGPLLILAHTTFRVGSLNAAVALFSMLLVSASGVVGRFLYLRIHRGLGGERHTLTSLRTQLGLAGDDATGPLAFAPKARQQLRALDQHYAGAANGWPLQFKRLFVLPLQMRQVRSACQREATARLAELGSLQGWDAQELRRRKEAANGLIHSFGLAVLRVAQFSACVKLFALWHVVHIPFVYLMVLCAVVHVVAVHAY